jgi:predicted dehydrogenase
MIRTLLLPLLSLSLTLAAQEAPFRIALAGLTHGHAGGFLSRNMKRNDMQLVGISEPSAVVREKYIKTYSLDPKLLFASHEEMLRQAKPEAVMLFNDTAGHRPLVELCDRYNLPVMMEKPLATNMADALAMGKAKVPVMVNYETTWYAVNTPILEAVKHETIGKLRRIVTHYGHYGPKEIGVGDEFLSWLVDPAKNGAGALFDFGCYGANFATWLLNNQRPISVTAMTATNKPDIYAKVDDEATYVVQYPGMQLIVEASWNWPFSRKDMALYGSTGQLITSNPTNYKTRSKGERAEHPFVAAPLASPDDDVVNYLRHIVRGKVKPTGLSSYENNLIVTEILAAARESARTGRTIVLPQK